MYVMIFVSVTLFDGPAWEVIGAHGMIKTTRSIDRQVFHGFKYNGILLILDRGKIWDEYMGNSGQGQKESSFAGSGLKSLSAAGKRRQCRCRT